MKRFRNHQNRAGRGKYLGLGLQEASIEHMRGIKTIFDPRGILNPGKIFP